MATKEQAAIAGPCLKMAKRKNGTFKITRNKLTCSGVILDSRMAVPDKPPSSTPEGSRNSATPGRVDNARDNQHGKLPPFDRIEIVFYFKHCALPSKLRYRRFFPIKRRSTTFRLLYLKKMYIGDTEAGLFMKNHRDCTPRQRDKRLFRRLFPPSAR